MSANNSWLSQPRYGYDLVVATTQASINATMKKYLGSLAQKETYVCYVYNPNTKSNDLISFQDLKDRADGTDPFAIPKDAAFTDSRVQSLRKAKFVAGIKLTLGLPGNVKDPAYVPDMINLQNGADKVKYRMYCKDIQIATIETSLYDDPVWKALSQNETPNDPWLIESEVDLRLDTGKSTNLPSIVYDQIKNLGENMFSVQQLLFDLNNAALSTIPEIKGIKASSPAGMLLTGYFVGTYFALMQKQGQPVLNYTIVPNQPMQATLNPSDLNFHVSPLVKETNPALKTLDYLCATGTNKLPPAVNFNWDWITASDSMEAHGVIAINRATFARYLTPQLLPIAQKDCFTPVARTWYEFPVFRFSISSDSSKTPSLWFTYPETGSTIAELYYEEQSEDRGGPGGTTSHIVLKQRYKMSCIAEGNKLIIRIQMGVFLLVKHLQTQVENWIQNRELIDQYELGVTKDGKMSATKTTLKNTNEPTNNKTDELQEAFTGVNEWIDDLKSTKISPSTFESHTINELQNFIFPGGNTFVYNQLRFSDHSDLISWITYL